MSKHSILCNKCKSMYPTEDINKKGFCRKCAWEEYQNWQFALQTKQGERYRKWLIACLNSLEHLQRKYLEELARVTKELYGE